MTDTPEDSASIQRNRDVIKRLRGWGALGGALSGAIAGAVGAGPSIHASLLCVALVVAGACGLGALIGFVFIDVPIGRLAARGRQPG